MAVKHMGGFQDAGPGFSCNRQECPWKPAFLVWVYSLIHCGTSGHHWIFIPDLQPQPVSEERNGEFGRTSRQEKILKMEEAENYLE